jgi:hypothetical protein
VFQIVGASYTLLAQLYNTKILKQPLLKITCICAASLLRQKEIPAAWLIDNKSLQEQATHPRTITFDEYLLVARCFLTSIGCA